jgi:hypothetical protein
MSGSKISFLNQSNISNFGKKRAFDENGKEMFSPNINDKSRLMSPRDKDTTF